MKTMITSLQKFLQRNILVVAVLSAAVLAFLIPSVGKQMYDWHLVLPCIVAVFLCQGMTIKGDVLQNMKPYFRMLVGAFVLVYCLYPVLGYVLMKFPSWPADYIVGFTLMCCTAPTLVSATVLTGLAKGDAFASLLITIVLSLVLVFTLPLNLLWTLGEVAEIPVLSIMLKILLLVLLPSCLGYGIRRKNEKWAQKHSDFLKYAPILFLSIPIFMSFSNQMERLKTAWEPMLFLQIVLAAVLVHGLLIVLSYVLGKKMLKLSEPISRALAFGASQKTVPVTIAVWSAVFAKDYPLALIPVMIFHFTQIYCDGFVAQYWAKKSVKD